MPTLSSLIAASALIAALAAPSTLAAHEVKAGSLTIDAPWARATPSGAKTAAGYMKITNAGQEADKLVGGSAEGIGKVEVHEMSMKNDVMQMRHLSGGLEIKPGETIELKPGGYHLMLIGLKQPLKQGETVKGTLTFEKAGSVPITLKVEAIGAGAGHAPAHKH